MKISNYFSIKEATTSRDAIDAGIKNVYSNADLKIISYTAARLDTFRAVLGKPINVNSWFRNKEVNELVEGSKNSFHMKGLAVDITCPSMHPTALYKALRDAKLSFDQLIVYNTFVHIGFKEDINEERKQLLDYRK